LTPEQNEKMDDLRKKYWEETRSHRQNLFSKKQELWKLYSEEKPDRDKISKLEREIFDLQQDLREKHFVFKQEARKIVPRYRGGYGYGRCGRHMGPGWGGHMMGSGGCGYHRGPAWGGQMMGPHGGCPWRGSY
jgi:Spy/CpxP family protein refolding chaperone